MTRWKVLPRDQCQGYYSLPSLGAIVLAPSLPFYVYIGIRNFIVNFIIENSNSEEKLKSERAFLNKLNLVLVSILKQEWPHNWPTFINEIVSSCRTSLSICENNMVILRLLS